MMANGGDNTAGQDAQRTSKLGGWLQRSNKKVLFVVVIVVVAIAFLMTTSLRGALTYYQTVDELKARGPDAYGEQFRVGGRVRQDTIVRDASNNLTFVLYHDDYSNSLPVQYRGIVPDIFGDEVDVIIEGRWNAAGVFRATNLLAQHPPEFKVAKPGKPHDPVEDRAPR